MKTITTVLAGTALMLGVTTTTYAVPTLTLTNSSTNLQSATTLDLVHNFALQFGGIADGRLNFNAFFTPNNVLNAETTQIGSTLTNPTNGAFSTSGSGSVTVSGPYSLGEEVTIPLDPDMQTSSLDTVTTVPEPASLVLVGAGFFSLAIYGKRRRKA